MEPNAAWPGRDFLARSAAVARRRRYVSIGVVILILIAAAGLAIALPGSNLGQGKQGAEARYIWAQILPDDFGQGGGRLIRAIVTGGDRCPKIDQGSHELAMRRRLPRVASAFPIVLCEAELDRASEAYIGTYRLPLVPAEPRDITVVGDTGCRLVHYVTQLCRDGVKWPFPTVAVNAARAIKSNAPQSIIIHVGDFHYREISCADDEPGCAGSPVGDNWATWEEEFFKPAGPLLLAAPWVILRGNHENCARAGAGWLFFFGLPDQDYKGVCQDDNLARSKYNVSIGHTGDHRPRILVVLDTANENDSHGMKKRCGNYQNWFKDFDPAGAEVWIALHQPLWYYDKRSRDGQQRSAIEPCEKTTKSAVDAIRARLSPAIDSVGMRLADVVLSGDIHMFQFVRPSDQRLPIQIVAGNSGTCLDPPLHDESQDDGAECDAAQSPTDDFDTDHQMGPSGLPGSVWAIRRHGYVTLHQNDTGWELKLQDITGQSLASCRILEVRGSVQTPGGPQSGCDEQATSSSGQ